MGPRVSFANLSDGQKLPLRWQLQLNVEDTDGVRSASVWCLRPSDGERVLLSSWSAAPFVREVSFAACLPRTGGVVGAGPTELILEASAEDNRGLPSQEPVRRRVHVDPTLPALSIELPSSVEPNARVQFALQSDIDLIAPPSVVTEGFAIEVVPGAEPHAWTATFTAPQLGTEVLDEIRRVFPLTVNAVAVNGNSLTVTRDLVVSRVRWERPVAGNILDELSYDGASDPVSNDLGLWVPLAVEGDVTDQWLPGFLDGATGQLHESTLDPSMHRGRTLGRDGLAIVDAISSAKPGNSSWIVDPTGKARNIPGFLYANRPVLRLPDRTCVQEEEQFQVCSQLGGRVFLWCGSPTGYSETPRLDFNGRSGPGVAALGSVSGDTALSVEFRDFQCQGALDTTTLLLTRASGDGGSIASFLRGPAGGFRRIIPLGQSGRFAIDWYDVTGARQPPQRIERDGSQSLAYFTDAGSPNALIDDVVVGRDDGTLVTLTSSGSDSELRAWEGDAVTTQPLPGRFRLPATHPRTGSTPYGVSFPDGRIAFLAKTHEFGRVVVGTDAQLQPRWIYRYPRGTGNAVLVSDTAKSHLYLVDLQNDVVVALSRDW